METLLKAPLPANLPATDFLDGAALPAAPVDSPISEAVASGNGLQLIASGVEGLLAASLFIGQLREMLKWIYAQQPGEPAL